MAVRGERYIVDEKGKRVGVVLDMAEYRRMLGELECIRAYDAAKASGDEAVTFDWARDEIGRERQCSSELVQDSF